MSSMVTALTSERRYERLTAVQAISMLTSGIFSFFCLLDFPADKTCALCQSIRFRVNLQGGLLNQVPHLAVFLVLRWFAAFLAGGFKRFRALYFQHPKMKQDRVVVHVVRDLFSHMGL